MNEQFDNRFTQFIVTIIGTVVRTLERSIVVFWDGMRNATVHGTPSLLGFIAAIAPVLAPIPIATQTAISLMEYMSWLPFQAVIMAAVIECAGFVLWVFLTESLMRDGWQGTTTQYTFGGAVVVYEMILILINVALAANAGTRGAMAFILFLACLFPALTSIAYGYNNSGNREQLERESQEAKEWREREYSERMTREERERQDRAALEERIRQERREDSLRRAEMKLQYASDVKREELKEKPFRGNK